MAGKTTKRKTSIRLARGSTALKRAGVKATTNTSLKGYLTISYRQLVAKLGRPHSHGDGYKMDAEWVFRHPASKNVITIYNYKDGPNYRGEKGTPVSKIREWHVGGHKREAVDIIGLILGCPYRHSQ